MTTILVPYHLDERLADDSIPLPAESDAVLVTPDLPDGDVWQRLTSLYDAVATAVASRHSPDAMTTVVSGDCLVALGTITGTHRAGVDASVVWFDAHGDVHTRQTSTSGYLGGMALRLVTGAHPELIAEPLGLPALAEGRVVLVDARDLDPAEKHYLASSELRRCSVDDLDAGQLPDGAVILHIDLDVMDVDELPGMRFPAPGGPSIAAVLAAAGRVLSTGRVVTLNVSCPWNPAQSRQEVETRARVLTAITHLR